MSVPFKSVRVGPFTIPIKTLTGEDAERNLGLFSSDRMTIWLHPKFESEQRQAEVLMHEIVHAMVFVYGVKEKDKEERFVAQMSVAMVGAIRDNPRLFAWIKQKLS